MTKSLKIARYLIMAGLFVSPFFVLIVSGSLFFPFITGKNFFFRILTEILACLWLILAIFDKNYRPKKTLILYSVLAFTAAVAISGVFGVNFYRSFWSNFERMEGVITYLHLLVYFLVASCCLNSEKLWRIFFHSSLFASFCVSIYGLMQLGGQLEVHQGGVRLDATLGNASYLAIYLVFHIFLAAFYFFKTHEWYKWLYVPLIVLETSILYYTGTRGAILGLIGGVMLATILAAYFSSSARAKIFFLAMVLAAVFGIAAFWTLRDSDFIKNSPMLQRFAGISFSETTTQSRLVIWKMSLEGFKERPLFGWGQENYNLVFNKFYQPILYKQEAWFDRAHNVFVDKLIQNGLVGLLSYLGLFGCFLYCLWFKRDKIGFSLNDSVVLTALLAAYFFHNLFVFDNIVSSVLFFSFLAYVQYRLAGEKEKGVGDIQKKKGKIFPSHELILQNSAYAVVVCLIAVGVVYFVNVPGMMTSRDLINAFYWNNQGEYQKALEFFKQAIGRNSFGTVEAQEHLSQFAMRVLASPDSVATKEFKQEVYDYAAEQLKKQEEILPGDIRTLVFEGSLYNRGGQYDPKQYDNAIDVLRRSIDISPNKQMLYFELASSYLNKGEYDSALQAMKTAYELETSYREAKKIYALTAVYAGEYKKADELINEILDECKKIYGDNDAECKSIVYDDKFVNAYTIKGKYDRVAGILENMVNGSPDNYQLRIRLAAGYLQVGRREASIKQLEKVIELNPGNQDIGRQINFWISEIRAGRNPQ